MTVIKGIFLLLVAISTTASANEQFDLEDEDFGVILSANKLKTAKKNVSGSVTKITREQIEVLNIRTIPEALRLAPGMNAYSFDGNQYYASYRGTNYPEPRRMSLYIDGVPFVRSGLSQIDWNRLPINIEDISSIEVYRGPNSATYGSGAFLAVVNITTLHPNETLGLTATATLGSINTKDVLIRYSLKITDSDSLKLSLSTRKNSGFDKKADGTDRLDSIDSNLFNYYYTHEVNSRSKLDFQGGIIDGNNGREPVFSEEQLFPSIHKEKKTYNRIRWVNGYGEDSQISSQIYHKTNKIKEDVNICFPALLLTQEMHNLFNSNQNYVNSFLSGQLPSGGTDQDNMLLGGVMGKVGELGGIPNALQPVCGITNQDLNSKETSLSIDNITSITDDSRVVLGASYRDIYLFSETFGGIPVSKKIYNVHGQLELQLTQSNILNVGGSYEKNDGDTHFSPKIGLNHHFDELNTFRFLYSKAVRNPSLFEKEANWTYKVKDLNPVLNGLGNEGILFLSYRADGTVRDENIESWELGYHFESSDDNLYFDVKIFKDNLDDLISEAVKIPNWNASNNNSSILKGVEVESQYKLNDSVNFYSTYAYVDVKSESNYEVEFNPSHTFSIYSIYKNNNSWSATMGMFYANKLRGHIYSRFESTISKSFDLGDSNLSFNLSIKHRLDGGREVLEDNLYDNNTHFFLTMVYTTE